MLHYTVLLGTLPFRNNKNCFLKCIQTIFGYNDMIKSPQRKDQSINFRREFVMYVISYINVLHTLLNTNTEHITLCLL